jgi:hypothetical protein
VKSSDRRRRRRRSWVSAEGDKEERVKQKEDQEKSVSCYVIEGID